MFRLCPARRDAATGSSGNRFYCQCGVVLDPDLGPVGKEKGHGAQRTGSQAVTGQQVLRNIGRQPVRCLDRTDSWASPVAIMIDPAIGGFLGMAARVID